MITVTVSDVRDVLRTPGDPAGPTGKQSRIPIGTDGPITDAYIQPIINGATGIVQAYTNGRDAPDGLIWEATRSVAAYNLVLSWRGSADLAVDDPVRLRFVGIMQLLEDIGSGKIDPSAPGDGDPSGGVAVVNLPHPRLTGFDWAGRPVVVDQPGHGWRCPYGEEWL